MSARRRHAIGRHRRPERVRRDWSPLTSAERAAIIERVREELGRAPVATFPPGRVPLEAGDITAPLPFRPLTRSIRIPGYLQAA